MQRKSLTSRLLAGDPVGNLRPRSAVAAFTLIELMVVIAIIVFAAAMMAPTVTEYMKNRQIDGVRGQLTSLFNIARLQAVSRRRNVSVVFFREGPRVYDQLSRDFTDYDVWKPKSSQLGVPDAKVWYALGCSSVRRDGARLPSPVSSIDKRFGTKGFKATGLLIPPFDVWLKAQQRRAERGGTKGRRSSRERSRSSRAAMSFDVSGLFAVTFQRDGTLAFGAGCSDVPSSVFDDERKSAPANADVVIFQVDGRTAGFIDLRATGQVRSKIGVLADPPLDFGEVGPIENAAGSRGKSKKRRR